MVPDVLPWLVALIVVEQVALYGATSFVNGGQRDYTYLVIAVASYVAVALIFVKALSVRDELGQLNTMWNVASTVLALAMGILLFGEGFGGWRHWTGALLGVTSLVLLGC
jgi:hypothetical protein